VVGSTSGLVVAVSVHLAIAVVVVVAACRLLPAVDAADAGGSIGHASNRSVLPLLKVVV